MATIIVYCPIGPTYGASVTASSTAAASVPLDNQCIMAFSMFLNTGTVAVAVNIQAVNNATGSGTAVPAVFPVSGTPQPGTFVLPAAMQSPMVVSVPSGFSYTMIGAGAGPSAVYITPVGIQ